MQVEAQLPAVYRENLALIRGIPTFHTDEPLMAYLGDQRVIKTRHCFRRNRSSSLNPPNLVSVFIREKSAIPAVVGLNVWHYRVHDYIDPPQRCFRCQGLVNFKAMRRSDPSVLLMRREQQLARLSQGIPCEMRQLPR